MCMYNYWVTAVMLHMADTQTECETASKARWKQIASMVSRTMQNKNTLRESHVHIRNIMYTDKISLSLSPLPSLSPSLSLAGLSLSLSLSPQAPHLMEDGLTFKKPNIAMHLPHETG